MNPDHEIELILVSVPDAETGKRLARQLAEERLIACANILPGMTSIYTWQGSVEEAEETLLILKTRPSLFERVESFLKREHPYDTPEIVGIRTADVSGQYREWLLDSTLGHF
ncbi:MAG: divalent-cation tolerance protein CutA [Deltaproteobacteria bacterium]|nr:divalent-cation tolerance protein CutA [Deltaproteobacteria bacterium]